ncbi:Glutathione import ATP-binding protein GsiA [Kluyvera cryocrescens]|uniref:Glutathione import ATP-binding protein GsiA n=1 Tax=Kluyvera cryocrescens TaxID=580 RepID=A0A485D1B0_KLUCR|nr:Glutathione import ATP-binding protein GsiA [Kluyvera cryocrescens]
MTVQQLVAEPMKIHGYDAHTQRERAEEMLYKVGLKPEHLTRFPHEFSGGQRQRISIARALSVRPEFVLCDEPLSALDVSVQAQVVNILQDLQQELGLTYLFIAHDLSMVRHISSRIGVMYLGKLVEVAPAGELYQRPAHPYTQALLASVPVADPRIQQLDRRWLKGRNPQPNGGAERLPFLQPLPRR